MLNRVLFAAAVLSLAACGGGAPASENNRAASAETEGAAAVAAPEELANLTWDLDRIIDIPGCSNLDLEVDQPCGLKYMVWSPDGQRIAVSSDGREGDDSGNVHIVHVDGSEAHRVGAANASASAVSWSPDGSRILADVGTELTLFDAASLEQLTQVYVPGATNPIWSPEGRRILAGGSKSRYDTERGLVVLSSTSLERLAFSEGGSQSGFIWTDTNADGSVVAVGGRKRDITLYDTNTMQVTSTIRTEDNHGVYGGLQMTPDGAHIAAASWEGLSVYKSDGSDQGKPIYLTRDGGDQGRIDIDASGKLIAYGHYDHIGVWNFETMATVPVFEAASASRQLWSPRAGDASSPTPLDIKWAPNSLTLAILTEASVELWRPVEN